jgi:hypothetical protein
MEKQDKMVRMQALAAERKKWKDRVHEMEEKLAAGEGVVEEIEDIDSNSEEEQQSGADYFAQFAELMQNPYYSDSGKYADELREYADAHNVDLKTAYNSLFAERKYEEIAKRAENGTQVADAARHKRKIDAVLGANGAPRSRARLNKEQLAAAEMCGMTAEEYARYM